jgi:aspartyl-tRNA(Asn)/glutamyl-tRNA(Gln) amidotransferase subunit A
VKGLRIGYSPDLGFAMIDPEVAVCVARVAEVLAGMGVTIVGAMIKLGSAQEIFPRQLVRWRILGVSRIDPEQREAVDPALRKAADFGASLPLHDYPARTSERLSLCRLGRHSWGRGCLTRFSFGVLR